MAIELHTTAKPAAPRRALFTSVFLLAFACVLAATMTWRRSGELLAPRIEPPDWSISFQHPKRLVAGQVVLTELGPAYVFHGRMHNGALATLAIYRLEGPDVADARAGCERVLHAYMGLAPPTAGRAGVTRFDTSLGDLDAVEVMDSQLGVVVRTASLGGSEAYAVSLLVEGTGIDRRAYELFDLTCGSVEYRPR